MICMIDFLKAVGMFKIDQREWCSDRPAADVDKETVCSRPFYTMSWNVLHRATRKSRWHNWGVLFAIGRSRTAAMCIAFAKFCEYGPDFTPTLLHILYLKHPSTPSAFQVDRSCILQRILIPSFLMVLRKATHACHWLLPQSWYKKSTMCGIAWSDKQPAVIDVLINYSSSWLSNIINSSRGPEHRNKTCGVDFYGN